MKPNPERVVGGVARFGTDSEVVIVVVTEILVVSVPVAAVAAVAAGAVTAGTRQSLSEAQPAGAEEWVRDR